MCECVCVSDRKCRVQSAFFDSTFDDWWTQIINGEFNVAIAICKMIRQCQKRNEKSSEQANETKQNENEKPNKPTNDRTTKYMI